MCAPLFIAVLALLQVPVYGRPKILQEQNFSYHKNFLQDVHVGFQSLLCLMGYYEDEEVKDALKSETLEINEADKEDQTEVGLGLGSTGSTSTVVALEILGYSVVHDDEHPELTDLFEFGEMEEIDSDDFYNLKQPITTGPHNKRISRQSSPCTITRTNMLKVGWLLPHL